MRFRAENPQHKETKMTYLGRLDPMAEGLLLVLSGDTRDKNKFLDLDKTYEFEVLWGVSTDTYDVLGQVESMDSTVSVTSRKLESVLKKILSKKTQSYPPYSSRPVGGKALFQWAREGKIEEIDVPTRNIKIFNIEHVHTRIENSNSILADILKKISLVKGDFRQEEIIKTWQKELGSRDENMYISKFVVDVSSGTYVRGLAHEMGQMLGVPALAYRIKRTRVGEYSI